MCDTRQPKAEQCRVCGVAFGKRWALRLVNGLALVHSACRVACTTTADSANTGSCSGAIRAMPLTVRMQVLTCAWSAHSSMTRQRKSSFTAAHVASAVSAAARSFSTATPAAAATPGSWRCDIRPRSGALAFCRGMLKQHLVYNGPF